MDTQKKLTELRDQIDGIDQQIVDAINKRTEIVLKIGSLKNESNTCIYAPDREHEVYKRVFSKNKGPIKNKALEAIYREIMSASLALEKEIVIGFMGPEGSYSHQACIRKFGASLPIVALPTIQDAFKAVEKNECDYSVVPIENSTEGGVTDTLDMFVDSPVHICSEIAMPIQHCFLTKENDIKHVKRVYSNPQVLAQCRQWLLTHAPHVELIEMSSSSRAAQHVNKEPGTAAIGSALCGKLYDLNVLYTSIQDLGSNVTRFAVLSNSFPKPTGNDKTSVLVFLKDRVGALYDMLLFFKGHDLNLTRIESRPSKRRPWEYYFFIDFVGHCDDLHVHDLLENLKNHSEVVKVLGSYPIYKEPVEEPQA